MSATEANREGNWALFHMYNSEESGLRLEQKELINDEEVERLKNSNRTITEFFASRHVVESVFANRDDVAKALVAMTKAYIDTPHLVEQILEQANFDLARRFANTCSLFRSLLDHFDRYLLKRHGPDSEQYQSWKNCLSTEYDLVLAYRIVYHMRNYIQHYDMPPLSLSITDKADEEGFSVRVDIDVDRLMEDKTFKNKLVVDSFEDRAVSLFHILDDWDASCKRLVEHVTAIRVQEALPAAHEILNVRKALPIGDHGRIAMVYLPAMDKRPEKVSLNLNHLHETKAQIIVRLAEQYQANDA